MKSIRGALLAVCAVAMTVMPAHESSAALWGTLINFRITSCGSSASWGPCSAMVMYAADGVSFLDVVPVRLPDPLAPLTLIPWGLHCTTGDRTGNFGGCNWRSALHGPTELNPDNCRLRDYSSWDMADKTGCQTVINVWGPHTGAGPGAECIIWGQGEFGQASPGLISTPLGLLDAGVVANSRDAYCVKAPPPQTPCDIQLPPEIDHGVVAPGTNNTVDVTGTLSCGSTPVVDILGGGRASRARSNREGNRQCTQQHVCECYVDSDGGSGR